MEITDTNIRRFKLIEMNDKEFYLVDVDTHKLSWLFPTVAWYLKNKAMKIDEKEYELLKCQKKEEGSQKMTLRVSTFMLGGTLYKLIDTMWGEKLNNNTISTMILGLFVLILLLLFLRAHRSLSNFEQLETSLLNRNLKFDKVISFDKNDKNEFRKKSDKGFRLILILYPLLIIIGFLSKSLFFLILLFIVPFIAVWANGALKPDSDIQIIIEKCDSL